MTEQHPDNESEDTRRERHRRAERRHWTFEKFFGIVVLILTAIAGGGAIASAIASFGAYNAANRAVEAAIKQNEINIRPYVTIKFLPETFMVHTSGNASGDLRAVRFKLENIGKLPALVSARSASNWNGKGHSGNDTNWPSIGTAALVFLFPGDPAEFTSQATAFTQGNLSDIASGDTYYVMVDAWYGPSQNIQHPSNEYETKVCVVFKMKRETDVIRLGDSDGPCPAEGGNYAK